MAFLLLLVDFSKINANAGQMKGEPPRLLNPLLPILPQSRLSLDLMRQLLKANVLW
jgi:hypothetical protein